MRVGFCDGGLLRRWASDPPSVGLRKVPLLATPASPATSDRLLRLLSRILTIFRPARECFSAAVKPNRRPRALRTTTIACPRMADAGGGSSSDLEPPPELFALLSMMSEEEAATLFEMLSKPSTAAEIMFSEVMHDEGACSALMEQMRALSRMPEGSADRWGPKAAAHVCNKARCLAALARDEPLLLDALRGRLIIAAAAEKVETLLIGNLPERGGQQLAHEPHATGNRALARSEMQARVAAQQAPQHHVADTPVATAVAVAAAAAATAAVAAEAAAEAGAGTGAGAVDRAWAPLLAAAAVEQTPAAAADNAAADAAMEAPLVAETVAAAAAYVRLTLGGRGCCVRGTSAFCSGFVGTSNQFLYHPRKPYHVISSHAYSVSVPKVNYERARPCITPHRRHSL